MDIAFLSPFAALLALAVAVPLAAIALRERRHGNVRSAIGLGDPPARVHLPEAVALVVAFGLLGAAAAQPVVRIPTTVEKRTDAEAYVVIDITRSMLAGRSAESPTRIERAKQIALDLRRALPDVPFGVASHTNRSLPHLFPTADAAQYELVVTKAVGINRPPGTESNPFARSTDFSSFGAFATENFFSAGSTKRLAIFMTDGESNLFAERKLAEVLADGGVELLLVQLWEPEDRVWQQDGTAEPAYRTSEVSREAFLALGELTLGGRVYDGDELAEVISAARGYLGSGPLVEVSAPGRTVSLAPHAVLAACIPLGFLLLGGLLHGFRARPKLAYSMLPRWRASSTPDRRRSRATRAPSLQTSSGTRSPMGASSPGGD
jgi:hypothetical protein